MSKTVVSRFGLAVVAVLLLVAFAGGQPSASAQGPVAIGAQLSAGDYVMFAQTREGKAAETSDDGSNNAQAQVSGSENSVFGRIRSNADFYSAGQNMYYHYTGNGNNPSVPSTPAVNDGKVTFRFQNQDGDNFYETPLGTSSVIPDGPPDPRHPLLTDGTWLPVQSDVPVGPVGVVPTSPVDPDVYQFWPGDLHRAVTGPSPGGSNYLEMDTAALEPHCDFGSLTGGPVEWDLKEDGQFTDGTYCTNGGVIKLAVQDAGSTASPKRFTFLAKDGLISISGQNAFIEPFALGILAMSDLHSDSDQFPIKISGSDFRIQRQSIVFAPQSGVDVSGSDGSTLCLHVVGQEVKFQGSTTDFGPTSPNCFNPDIELLKTNTLTTDNAPIGVLNAGDVVTYTYTVTNTGNVELNSVSLFDDQEGALTLTDVANNGVDILAIGDIETASSAHTITQAEADAGTLTNVADVTGTSTPTGTQV